MEELPMTAQNLPSGAQRPDGPELTLVSHHLCPYVQRAAIALSEKNVAFTRRDVDLANKPDWFLKVSPLGKTPVLIANDMPIFESAVILEYLEETTVGPLHPGDALTRAQHRGWVEFASQVLNDIAGLYNAADEAAFAVKVRALRTRFERLEATLGEGPWFGGDKFSLVDAAFGPVFRYFDVFDTIGDFGILTGLTKTVAWRSSLADRPSVRAAVAPDYAARLRDFLIRRQSFMSSLMSGTSVEAA